MDHQLGEELSATRDQLDRLQDSVQTSSELCRPSHIDGLREFVHSTQQLLSKAQTSLALRTMLNEREDLVSLSPYIPIR